MIPVSFEDRFGIVCGQRALGTREGLGERVGDRSVGNPLIW